MAGRDSAYLPGKLAGSSIRVSLHGQPAIVGKWHPREGSVFAQEGIQGAGSVVCEQDAPVHVVGFPAMDCILLFDVTGNDDHGQGDVFVILRLWHDYAIRDFLR